SVIQSLIVGNMTTVPTQVKHFKVDSSGVSITQKEGIFKSVYQWSVHPFLLKESQYRQLKGTKYAEQQYADYQQFTVGDVSIDRKITIGDSSVMKIRLKFDKIKFNQSVSFPFP